MALKGFVVSTKT